LAGYIIVTYRLSTLSSDVWRADDSVALVRRESDRSEADALAALCCASTGTAAAALTLTTLGPEEAALLPGAFEAHGGLLRFTVAPRLTTHVRHRSKYLDTPIAEDHAFVFGEGARGRHRARSLKEFMSLLDIAAPGIVLGHLRRQDFSRWIDHVFRDGPLATRIRTIERGADGEASAVAAAGAIG